MTDMWDIARYLESHPEDHDARWRLSKKMYMAWEYRHALEHLQVLSNEGPRKLNVNRYLAATYYRLGRYDESIAELHASIKIWPQEISLQQQLARVLEVSGDCEAAAEVWEEVKTMAPDHPLAGKAVERLKKVPRETFEKGFCLSDSDGGIDLRHGQVCTNCEAQNSDESEHCWQCLAPLSPAQSGIHKTPRSSECVEPLIKIETVKLIMGMTIVGMFSAAVYLSLRLLASGVEGGQTGPFIFTLRDLYVHELGVTRAVTGCVILIVWPMALLASVHFFRGSKAVPADLVIITGLFLATLTYLGSWVDMRYWPLCLLLSAGLAFAAAKGAFVLSTLRALGVWAFHLMVVSVAAWSTILLSEVVQLGQYYNPVTEVQAVWQYLKEARGNIAPEMESILEGRPPMRRRIVWNSTGSAWLDHRAGEIQFVVLTSSLDGRFKFELKKEDVSGTRIYEPIRISPWKRTYLVKTGEPYQVIVQGEGDSTVTVKLAGMLQPKVLE